MIDRLRIRSKTTTAIHKHIPVSALYNHEQPVDEISEATVEISDNTIYLAEVGVLMFDDIEVAVIDIVENQLLVEENIAFGNRFLLADYSRVSLIAS